MIEIVDTVIGKAISMECIQIQYSGESGTYRINEADKSSLPLSTLEGIHERRMGNIVYTELEFEGYHKNIADKYEDVLNLLKCNNEKEFVEFEHNDTEYTIRVSDIIGICKMKHPGEYIIDLFMSSIHNYCFRFDKEEECNNFHNMISNAMKMKHTSCKEEKVEHTIRRLDI